MQVTLVKILMIIIAVDIFALGIMVLFLINARINLKREIIEKRFFYRAIEAVKNAESIDKAAKMINVPADDFKAWCEVHNIETPEKRLERLEKEKKAKEEEERRIMEEEAKWIAEQERLTEEQNRFQEEDARKQKERLKKFGFK